jgi:hypothetical protein
VPNTCSVYSKIIDPHCHLIALSAALATLGISPTYDWASLEESSDHAIDLWVQQVNLKRNGKYNESDGIFKNATQWDEILRHYAAIVDGPGNEFAIDLAQAYPKAKVILTIRDSPEVWLASWKRTVYHQQVTWNNSWSMRVMGAIDDFTGLARKPKTDRVMAALAGGKFAYGDPNIQWYNNHLENAHKYIPADRLLEFNVKQGWEPLCRFLGKEIPNVPFPHTNDAAYFNSTIYQTIREQQQRLQWLVIGALFLVAAPVALMFGPLAGYLGTALPFAMIG